MKTTQAGILHGYRGALAALFALAMLFALAPNADAHAHLVKSAPEKEAVLTKAPARIDLWFNELLEDGFNTILVYPKSELGKEKPSDFTDGKVTVDPKDRTHLTVKLKALAPGEYVVDWRVLSRDGHSAPGRITFTVGK